MEALKLTLGEGNLFVIIVYVSEPLQFYGVIQFFISNFSISRKDDEDVVEGEESDVEEGVAEGVEEDEEEVVDDEDEEEEEEEEEPGLSALYNKGSLSGESEGEDYEEEDEAEAEEEDEEVEEEDESGE